MKRFKVAILIVLLVCLASSMFGRTIHAGRGGFRLIQNAIDAMRDGDTLKIFPGTYRINDTLKISNRKRIKVIGMGNRVHIICRDRAATVINFSNCKDVTISGIHATHSPTARDVCGGYVLNFSKCENVNVTKCELDGCGTVGVAGYRVTNMRITGNYLHNNTDAAISIYKCNNVTITGNRIMRNKKVISKHNCENVTIRNNRIANNEEAYSPSGETSGTSSRRSKVINVGPNYRIKSLARAVKMMKSGDTIMVYSGTYKYGRTISIRNKNRIKIYGMGRVNLICTDSEASVMSLDKCKNVMIRNIHMSHDPRVRYACAGFVLELNNCTNIRVNRCELNGCGTVGIYAYKVKNLYASYNYIHSNSRNAMVIHSSRNVRITRNRIMNNGGGIRVTRSTRVRKYRNTMRNNNVRRESNSAEAPPQRGEGNWGSTEEGLK